VRICLRRPWGWVALLIVLHAGTIALLWAGGVPSPVAAALTVLLAAHAVHATRRGLFLLDESPLLLELGSGGDCIVTTRGGVAIPATVSDSTVVSGALVVIVARPLANGPTHWIPVLSGMADPDTLRRLRVHLRWDRAPRRAGGRQR
jgi:hypothetical protein